MYGTQKSPAVASVLANLPRLIVSYIYAAYNSFFTSMLATAEWVGYSLSPRGLRVTWPKGQQRSRAFLQLPHIYAIPIMTASTLLHWLISQSLFLVSNNHLRCWWKGVARCQDLYCGLLALCNYFRCLYGWGDAACSSLGGNPQKICSDDALGRLLLCIYCCCLPATTW